MFRFNRIIICFLSVIISSQLFAADCDYGLNLVAENHYNEAVDYLIECCDSNDSDVQYCLALCRAYLGIDDFDMALSTSESILITDPNAVDAWYMRAAASLAMGSRDVALESLNTGLTCSTSHVPTLELLSGLLLEDGENQKAYGLLIQLVRSGGGTPPVHKTLSEIAQNSGLWRVASQHWADMMSMITPTSVDYLTAGELAIMAGDLEYALLVCTNAVAVDSTAQSLVALGEAQFAAKLIPESVLSFRKALEFDPEMHKIHFNLANAFELSGRIEEAEQEFELYILREPADPDGYYNLAAHHVKLGNILIALSLLNDSCELNPGTIQPHLLRIELLEQTGDLESAVEKITDLMEITIDNDGFLAKKKDIFTAKIEQSRAMAEQGKVKLLHIITADPEAVKLLQEELMAGNDFASLAVRFSSGPTAAEGGLIGWISISQMAPPIREAIEELGINENSPPVYSGELFHFFRRIH
jgi:tetratricopeptide (TPR) repeat protein